MTELPNCHQAETRALQGDQIGATAAYNTANEKSGMSNIDLLSGWADSLVKEKKLQQVHAAIYTGRTLKQHAPLVSSIPLSVTQATRLPHNAWAAGMQEDAAHAKGD